MPMNKNKQPKNWEEEFDKRFELTYKRGDPDIDDVDYDDLKSFISKEITNAVKEREAEIMREAMEELANDKNCPLNKYINSITKEK